MRLAKDNEVVHAFTADRPDQPFGESNRLVSDAHGAQSTFNDGAEEAIPVADEIARSLVPGERLYNLTRNPFRCWMPCDVDPDEGPAVEPADDEHIKHGEVEGRDDKQIHRRDLRA